MINVPEALKYAADKWGYELNDMTVPADPDQPDDPCTGWNIFDFSWIRNLFQNIIHNLCKGWNLNMSF